LPGGHSLCLKNERILDIMNGRHGKADSIQENRACFPVKCPPPGTPERERERFMPEQKNLNSEAKFRVAAMPEIGLP
jgi:hypothetical protein